MLVWYIYIGAAPYFWEFNSTSSKNIIIVIIHHYDVRIVFKRGSRLRDPGNIALVLLLDIGVVYLHRRPSLFSGSFLLLLPLLLL